MKNKKTIKQTGDYAFAAIDSEILIVTSPQKNINKFKELLQEEQAREKTNIFESVLHRFSNLFKTINTISFESYESSFPPVTKLLSIRKKNIAQYISYLDSNTWIHLYGGFQAGKTHFLYLLAKSFSEKFQSKVFWIKCKDYKKEDLAETLINEIMSLFKVNDLSSISTSLEKIPKNSIFVFDDLPINTIDENTKTFIETLISLCQKYNLKLLSSSSTDINYTLKSVLEPKSYLSDRLPTFDDEEVCSILENHSSLSTEKSKYISQLINTFSNGNPAIISAHIQNLKQHNWTINEFLISNIQKGFSISELNDFIQDTLTESLTDSQAKELLYRLSIISDDFNDNYVQKIGEITPSINYINEKFRVLDGYWIQSFDDFYKCNPVIKNLGEKNLSAQTLKQVHETIANLITESKILSPKQFISAFYHLVKAEQSNRAAFLLVFALKNLEESDLPKDYWGITDIWVGNDLPHNLNNEIKYLLKSQQIITRARFNKQIDLLLNDVHLLKNSSFNFKSDLIFSLVFQLSKYDIDSSLNILLEYPIFQNEPNILFEDSFYKWEIFIWILSTKIKGNTNTLEIFFKIIKKMSPTQFQNSLTDELGYSAIQYITSQSFIELSKNNLDLQDVQKSLETLKMIEGIGLQVESSILIMEAISSKIILYSEYLKDINQCHNVYTEALPYAKNNTTTFLLNYRYGKALYFSEQKNESKKYLKLAIEKHTKEYLTEILDALMLLASFNDEETLNLINRALELAKQSDFEYPMLLTRIYAELGTFHFLNGDNKLSYHNYEHAWKSINTCIDKDDNFKIGIVLFGHCTGYVSSIIKRGTAPSTINGEEYARPKIGDNWFYNNAVSQFYKSSEHEYLICFHLATIAETIGCQEKANYWYKYINNSIENTSNFYMMNAFQLVPYLILDNLYQEAIDVAISGNKICYSTLEVYKEKYVDVLTKIDTNMDMISKDKKREFYERTLAIVIIPIILHLNTNEKISHNNRLDLIKDLISSLDTQNQEINSLFLDLNKFIDSFSNPSNVAFPNELLKNRSSNEKCILYIITSEYAEIEEALKNHVQIIKFLYETFSNDEIILEKIVNNYFYSFWLKKFMNNWTDFINPYVLQDTLKQIDSTSHSHPAKEILRVLSNSYQFKLSEEIENFLNQ